MKKKPKHPSAVNVKIKELELTGVQKDKLREVINLLLDDVFYTILLGLDGESCIGNIQQTYRIYDEDNNLISDCGELEISACDYFNEHKYEKDNIKKF